MTDGTKDKIKDAIKSMDKPSITVNEQGWAALEGVLVAALGSAAAGYAKTDSSTEAKAPVNTRKVSPAQILLIGAAILTIYLMKRK